VIWITLAVIVVLLLAGYAGWLHYKLWKQTSDSKAAVDSTQPQQGADGLGTPLAGRASVEVSKSVYLIADAMLDDKMTHTEACLRICALSNHLSSRETFRREYGVLFTVAEATAHFPILDEWKSLDKSQQKAFTQERQSIEKKYADAVIEAATRVKAEFALR